MAQFTNSSIPSEAYPNGDPEGPWTPEVWQKGPDALVAKAQSALWDDQKHVGDVLGGADLAMAGNTSAPQNESDEIISGQDPSRSQRAQHWQDCLQSLRKTEPVVWSNKAIGGGLNPAP